MSRDLNHAVEYSSKWIDLIHKPCVPEDEGKWIIEESKYNFAEHFNRGWLEYRKSVTEAGQWAATNNRRCWRIPARNRAVPRGRQAQGKAPARALSAARSRSIRNGNRPSKASASM